MYYLNSHLKHMNHLISISLSCTNAKYQYLWFAVWFTTQNTVFSKEQLSSNVTSKNEAADQIASARERTTDGAENCELWTDNARSLLLFRPKYIVSSQIKVVAYIYKHKLVINLNSLLSIFIQFFICFKYKCKSVFAPHCTPCHTNKIILCERYQVQWAQM